jgi:hypothetical protein
MVIQEKRLWKEPLSSGGKNVSMDSLSPTERSEIMARVKSKNSRPELLVRRLVFALGYRYRLHAKDLPGHPGLGLQANAKGYLCAWLFLAPACKMRARAAAEIPPGFLGAEA